MVAPSDGGVIPGNTRSPARAVPRGFSQHSLQERDVQMIYKYIYKSMSKSVRPGRIYKPVERLYKSCGSHSIFVLQFE
jgi:hypothetical protein